MAKSPENQKQYQVAKEFKGVNTKANRTAIKTEEFAWLENVMPIGFGNLKSVPVQVKVADASGTTVQWSNTATGLGAVNINNADYIIAFEQNGGAEFFCLQTQAKGTVANAAVFSAANVTIAQWKNERAIILDPVNGLSTWDGNNTIAIGSVGFYGVNNPGQLFTSAPQLNVGPPDDPNGRQATATAVIAQNAGTLQQAVVDVAGDGFKVVPSVTVPVPNLPGGTQAVVTATISANTVVALNLIAPGSGYTGNTIPLTINGGAVTASGHAIVNTSPLQSVTPGDPGTGYRNPPAVAIIGGGGSNAVVTASLINFSSGTVALLPQNFGTNYTTASNVVVTIAGGGGTNAAAVASVHGDQINSYVMTNVGKNYTTIANLTVQITGGGGSNASAIGIFTSASSTGVESFSGRVWVAQGRTVFFSAAGAYNDFSSVSAGNFLIADTTLHSNVKGLLAANNFLYIFGEDSINVFSDVRVQSDGTTIFTNTNVSASVGSRYPNAVFPYYRTVMFPNDYGVFALVGATTTKLSEALDGIIPLIDFSKPVTAGQVVINNVLCASICFTYKDPVAGPRQLQAVFFEKKWFFTSQDAVKYVTNVPYQGQQQLYGTDGQFLFQLYGNATNSINTTVQSALWDLGDPIRTKKALKYGVEATLTTAQKIYVTVDSEAGSGNVTSPSSQPVSAVNWQNNNNVLVSWQNQGGAIVQWVSGTGVTSGFQLFAQDAQQYGKYIGLTMTSNTGAITFHTMELEHEFGARF